MRLLIATPLYPPDPGGPATYAKLLEEGLPPLGVGTTVVSFGEVRHRPKIIRHVAYARRLMRAGRSVDVMLALDPVSTGLPAALAAFLIRKPLVVKIVGDYAWEQGCQRFGITQPLDDFVRTERVPFAVAFLRRVETWVARRARLVIVPSEYLKRIVNAWGVPVSRIEVVPNAVALRDGGHIPKAMEALPHPRVIAVARLVPWKGIDGLIDAVAQARETGATASLVIIGEGPERARLEARARERLRDGFVFTGTLSPEDVHAALHASDIFVLNSSYEGFPHALVEALVAGLPVVATDAGGTGEALADGGLRLPTGDTDALGRALITVVTDEAERARLKRAAGDRTPAFSVPGMLERTKELLASTL